eukprot:gene9230-10191_t
MSSAIEAFQGYLGGKVRVLISDGRLVEGELQCLDGDHNLVLGDAVEFYGVQTDEAMRGEITEEGVVASRKLGMAMVPGRHVVKVLALVANGTA